MQKTNAGEGAAVSLRCHIDTDPGQFTINRVKLHALHRIAHNVFLNAENGTSDTFSDVEVVQTGIVFGIIAIGIEDQHALHGMATGSGRHGHNPDIVRVAGVVQLNIGRLQRAFPIPVEKDGPVILRMTTTIKPPVGCIVKDEFLIYDAVQTPVLSSGSASGFSASTTT